METTLDTNKVNAFAGKILGDGSGASAMLLAAIGDRLGIFKDLDRNGAATASELAARAGIQERYAREWLGGMAAAGYVEYDPASRRFTLPPEHAPSLAHENGPLFFGGALQILPIWFALLDRIVDAFRNGGGIPQADYDPRFWDAVERFTAGWFDNFCVRCGLRPCPTSRRSSTAVSMCWTLAVAVAARSLDWRRRFHDRDTWVTTTMLPPLI